MRSPEDPWEGFEVYTTDLRCEECDAEFNDHGAYEEQMAHVEEHITETGHSVAYEVTLQRIFSPEALP